MEPLSFTGIKTNRDAGSTLSAMTPEAVAQTAGFVSGAVKGLPTDAKGVQESTQGGRSRSIQLAIAALQHKLAQENPSVTLEAGLDPTGSHPNQVLLKLSDSVTRQVFYEYYVPAQQVVKMAQSGDSILPGTLMSEKA
ncbi:MAG: hypothetical protein ACP5GA_00610 [Acidithiobacillus sp.]